ncbi:MAG: GDP-mannose 4,6-dehydratase [bacterium]
MSERVVVIGSNSFSGSHFVDRLLTEGDDVVGISRSPEPNPVFLPYKARSTGRLRFFQLDLNKDLGSIIEVIGDFKPDYVVNFAAQGMVAQSWQRPEDWFQTNVMANVKFHDQLRKCEFLKKYVHVSTPEVYGSCEGVVAESTSYNPSTPYSVSRAAADMSLMSFFRAYRFPVVFTRSANVYGAGQQLYRIVPRSILCFLTGKKLALHGGGHSVRSFIHIGDVADGTLRIARMAPAGEIYHLSTPRMITIRALVEMIATRIGIPFDDAVDIVDDRLGKDAAYTLDSTKARAELGWRDTMTLERGIDETIEWVRDHLDVLKQQPWDYVHKP